MWLTMSLIWHMFIFLQLHMHIVRKQTSKISTPDKKVKLQRLENDNKINWKEILILSEMHVIIL